jgi:hypothetical protein
MYQIKVFDGKEWQVLKVGLNDEEAKYWFDVITRWGGVAIIAASEWCK